MFLSGKSYGLSVDKWTSLLFNIDNSSWPCLAHLPSQVLNTAGPLSISWASYHTIIQYIHLTGIRPELVTWRIRIKWHFSPTSFLNPPCNAITSCHLSFMVPNKTALVKSLVAPSQIHQQNLFSLKRTAKAITAKDTGNRTSITSLSVARPSQLILIQSFLNYAIKANMAELDRNGIILFCDITHSLVHSFAWTNWTIVTC